MTQDEILCGLLERGDTAGAHVHLYRRGSQELSAWLDAVNRDDRARMTARHAWNDASFRGRLAARARAVGDDPLELATLLCRLDADQIARLAQASQVRLPPDDSAWWILPPAKEIVASDLARGARHVTMELRAHLKLQCHVVEARSATGVSISVRELPRRISRALVADTRCLTVATARLGCEVRFQNTGRTNVHGESLVRADAQLDPVELDIRLKRLLDEIADAQILVLPEMEVSAPILAALRARLRTRLRQSQPSPALIVAGTAHITDDNGDPRNRCTLLDASGEIVGSQDKIVPYGDPDKRVEEDIMRGDTLVIYDGPAGRLATPICLDFCGDHLVETLAVVGVNLLLVPAWTGSLSLFKARARQHGTRSRAICVVSNGVPTARTHLVYLPKLDELREGPVCEASGAVICNVHEVMRDRRQP